MKAYIALAFSIVFEILGTAMLKTSEGFTILLPSIGVVINYGLSFYLFSLCLRSLPLSLAYAVWAGVGTAITALIGVIIWSEALGMIKLSGLALIIGGVILLNTPSKTEAQLSS